MITPEENVQELAKVTVADVQALAKELFQPEKAADYDTGRCKGRANAVGSLTGTAPFNGVHSA